MQPVLPVQAMSPARSALVSMARPRSFDPGLRLVQLMGRHARDQQVLPDREPDIAVAQLARDVGKSLHLRHRQTADRHDDADPIEAVLLLRMNAEMRCARERGPRRQRTRHGAVELAAELFFHQAEEFVHPQFVEHVFEPRLGAVGAVAGIDEHAHHRVGDLGGVGRLDQHAGVAGETVMSGEPAEAEPEPDAGLEPDSRPSPATAWKPMSLVSSSTGMMPAPSNPTLNLRGRP